MSKSRKLSFVLLIALPVLFLLISILTNSPKFFLYGFIGAIAPGLTGLVITGYTERKNAEKEL